MCPRQHETVERVRKSAMRHFPSLAASILIVMLSAAPAIGQQPMDPAGTDQVNVVPIPQPTPSPAQPWVATSRDVLNSAYEREPGWVMAAGIVLVLVPVTSLVAAGLRALAARGKRKAVSLDSIQFTTAVLPDIARTTTAPSVPSNVDPFFDVENANEPTEGHHVHRVRGTLIRIGRHEENDIRLDSQTVHRHHAVVHKMPDQSYVITDLSGPSGNGVYVNDERVEHMLLRNGDLVELGDVRMRFHAIGLDSVAA
jgi:FHA domain